VLLNLLLQATSALDLARLFDLPDRHPDRMIAAQIVLYVGLGIVPLCVPPYPMWRLQPDARYALGDRSESKEAC
jgi:hypothetical protein